MTFPIAINASSSPEVQMNENFETMTWAGTYGHNAEADTGLTRGYHGGRWGGFSVSDVAHTFGTNTTTYVSVKLSDGSLDFNTANTHYNDSANYARVEIVVSLLTTLFSATSDRGGPGGVFGAVAAGSVGASGVSVADAGSYFAGSDVEAVLQDLGASRAELATVTVITSSAGVVDIDCSLGDYFTFALSEAVTSITFSNIPAAGTKSVRITQDSTPRTVAWPASFKWAAGTPGAVSTGSGAVDMLVITSFDGGTAWQATLSNARA